MDAAAKKRVVEEELARIDEQLFRIEVSMVSNQRNADFAEANGNPISQREAMTRARQTLTNMRVDLLKRYEPLLKGAPKTPRKVAAPPAEEEPEAVLNLPRRPPRKR